MKNVTEEDTGTQSSNHVSVCFKQASMNNDMSDCLGWYECYVAVPDQNARLHHLLRIRGHFKLEIQIPNK